MPKNYVKVNDVVTENQLATDGKKSIMKEHSYFHKAAISRDISLTFKKFQAEKFHNNLVKTQEDI